MKESVNTIIQNAEGKFLLQMRDGTPGICNPLKWNFFGGGTDGEAPLVAAVRELHEELAATAVTDDFELVGNMEYDGGIVHVVRFKRSLEWENIKLQEGAGAAFFTLEQILVVDSTEQTRVIVRSFLSH